MFDADVAKNGALAHQGFDEHKEGAALGRLSYFAQIRIGDGDDCNEATLSVELDSASREVQVHCGTQHPIVIARIKTQ